MAEISILLPSLRKDAALQVIRATARTNRRVDYEILLVSPFAIQEPRVIHIFEEEPKGIIRANDMAFLRGSGKFIAWWSDETFPTRNCFLRMLKFIMNKKEPFIGSFRLKNTSGFEANQGRVYGKLAACWGMCSRTTLDLIGGLNDPHLKCLFSDGDRSLRAWKNGGRVEICPNAWVVVRQIDDHFSRGNVSRYFRDDSEAFMNRWHDYFGKGMPRDWEEINRQIPIKRRPTLRFMIGAITNMIPGMKRAKEVIRGILLNK